MDKFIVRTKRNINGDPIVPSPLVVRESLSVENSNAGESSGDSKNDEIVDESGILPKRQKLATVEGKSEKKVKRNFQSD